MKIVKDSNIDDIKKVQRIHKEKLTRFVFDCLNSDGNYLYNLVNSNLRFHSSQFHWADTGAALSVPELCSAVLVICKAKKIRLNPAGSVYILNLNDVFFSL